MHARRTRSTPLILFAWALGLWTFPGAAFGAASEEMDYDSIVKDLSTKSAPPAARSRATMPSSSVRSSLDDVLIHAGVGFSNMFGTISTPDGGSVYLNERGVEASLGIDLLSPQWAAEGSARSFSDAAYADNGVSLKEFDLKLLYKPRLSDAAVARVGFGLAGRYMTINRGANGTFDFATPATVGVLGLDVYLTPTFSVGAQASARSALISESADQFTYDASVRLDAHF